MYRLQKCCMCTNSYRRTIERCYQILNIKEDSDQETVRKAYIELAKKYHPDSGSPEADADKFAKVEESFRILNKKYSQDRWNVSEEQRIERFDIKHTAPQHRQYLSFEGVGSGTPSQREKQWIKTRATRAAQNVMEHRVSKAAATDCALLDKNAGKKEKHNIKTKYGIDRLVEDLIQEAMSKGEFSNLKGSGKPLPLHQNTNPYVDFITHKMNQVLIDNGFTPEWITLQKDIRSDIQCLRDCLNAARNKFGPVPLSSDDENFWLKTVEKYDEFTNKINSKITHYNLVVPILQKQMVFISLKNEAKKALENGKDNTQVISHTKIDKTKSDTDSDFISTLISLFKS